MTTPLVSVIIPAYNAQAYLEDAIHSALAQTLAHVEIVVVDDGATDQSGQIADAFAQRFPGRVKVCHQPNGGLCAARNAGIDHATAPFLALLDADDVWLPHHLEACLAVLTKDASVGLVHANIEWMDARGDGQGIPQGRWRTAEDPWAQIFLRQEHVSCPTAVFRRSVLGHEPAFDLGFNRLGCEDRDLWLRIAAVAGVVYLDQVHARYRLHAGNMSKQRDRMVAARLRLLDKHGATGRGTVLRKQALASVYLDLAEELRQEGQVWPSVRACVKAISQTPVALRAWKSTAAALLKRA